MILVDVVVVLLVLSYGNIETIDERWYSLDVGLPLLSMIVSIPLVRWTVNDEQRNRILNPRTHRDGSTDTLDTPEYINPPHGAFDPLLSNHYRYCTVLCH